MLVVGNAAYRAVMYVMWSVVCAVVWPFYYAELLFEHTTRPLFKRRDEDWLDYALRLTKRAKEPPFLDRLRRYGP